MVDDNLWVVVVVMDDDFRIVNIMVNDDFWVIREVASHDFRVDLIVTPNEVIECRRSQRPAGIYWESLTAQKIDSIPLLKASATAR